MHDFDTRRYKLIQSINFMKTMTCAELGGMCEERISAETPDEMIAQGMKHLEDKHQGMAATVKAMPEDDPTMVAWGEKFMKNWESTPESQ